MASARTPHSTMRGDDMGMTSAELSKLLFEAREQCEMWADVVERRMGQPDPWSRDVVRRLDEYRAHRGWSPHGFGGEDEQARLVIRMEFGFWGEDTRDSDLTRLSRALDALEAEGVIRYQVQLGHRAPYPDE